MYHVTPHVSMSMSTDLPQCSKPPLQVIARVPSLAALNGSAIGPHERRDSELRYLRMLTGRPSQPPS